MRLTAGQREVMHEYTLNLRSHIRGIKGETQMPDSFLQNSHLDLKSMMSSQVKVAL